MQVVTRILFSCACLALTAVASMMTSRNLDERAETQFATLVHDAQLVFDSRLNAYVQSLDAAAAFVASVPNIHAADWQNFVDLIEIPKNLPGASALSLIRSVPESQLDDFIARRRKDGMEDFSVYPEVDAAEHQILEFIAPLINNKSALGLDLKFDPVRSAVLEESRKLDKKVLSPPLKLVQSPDVSGFIFVRAVYSQTQSETDGLPEQPRNFLGWVTAPFVGELALANLTAQQSDYFGLAVHDVADGSKDQLIYQLQQSDEAHPPKFAVTLSQPMFGRTWSMRFTSTPSFEASVASYAPLIVLVTGLFVTALLSLFLDILVRRVNTVNSLVARRTKELKARVDENKSIVESAYIPILILNENDQIIQANAAALALTGFKSLSDIKGMPIENFATPATSSDISTWSGFGGWTHLGSAGRLLNIRKSSWRDAKGYLRHSLIIQDVTEEANAAQRITEAEQRWHIALNGADIGVFDIDLQTGKSIVSETWQRLMQVEDKDSDFDTQAEFLNRVDKRDLIRLKEEDRRCIDGETERSICEYRIVDRDGNWRWMRSDAAVAERSIEGKALRMIGAQMDVTDLRMAREAVEVSKKRVELMISEAPVGMAVFNNKGIFIGANDALCQLLGYREDQIVGNVRISDVLDIAVIKKILGAIGPQAVDRTRTYQAEHEWTAYDGSTIWTLLSISWTFDPEAQSDIYIAQLCDISEKKHIERMKSEFVATVSHELRTPLTSIKGALSLLETSAEFAQSPAKRLVEIARRNSDRLEAIVNDILDFEKLSSERISFDVAQHSLKTVIRDAATLIESMAEKRTLSIKLDLPDEDMIAKIDPARTHQVLANLLSNACKFSFPSSDVEVRVGVIGDFYIVYVCNRGVGIPASFRAQIFKPFVQADNSSTRQFEGTGLGLHIAKQIVDNMGGRIGFTSEPNKLTVFWFTVPIAQQETVKTLRSAGAR